MSKFKQGDRVRVTKRGAWGADVEVGDEGVISSVLGSDTYHFKPDVWRRTSSETGGGGLHTWYAKGSLELAEPKKKPLPKKKPEPEKGFYTEKIEALEKQVADLRKAQTLRADTIRKLRAELAHTEKERNALADTLAAIRQEQKA